MCSYLKVLEKRFVEQGGIKERMHAARTGYRQAQDDLLERLKTENEQLKAEVQRLKEELERRKLEEWGGSVLVILGSQGTLGILVALGILGFLGILVIPVILVILGILVVLGILVTLEILSPHFVFPQICVTLHHEN